MKPTEISDELNFKKAKKKKKQLAIFSPAPFCNGFVVFIALIHSTHVFHSAINWDVDFCTRIHNEFSTTFFCSSFVDTHFKNTKFYKRTFTFEINDDIMFFRNNLNGKFFFLFSFWSIRNLHNWHRWILEAKKKKKFFFIHRFRRKYNEDARKKWRELKKDNIRNKQQINATNRIPLVIHTWTHWNTHSVLCFCLFSYFEHSFAE